MSFLAGIVLLCWDGIFFEIKKQPTTFTRKKNWFNLSFFILKTFPTTICLTAKFENAFQKPDSSFRLFLILNFDWECSKSNFDVCCRIAIFVIVKSSKFLNKCKTMRIIFWKDENWHEKQIKRQNCNQSSSKVTG